MHLANLARECAVHVFEPIRRNAKLIDASAAHNYLEKVAVNNCAVGDSVGSVEFTVSEDSAFSSMVGTNRVPVSGRISVPILTSDAYLNENRFELIRVLKFDLEGAEAQVIEGAKALLQDKKRRPRLILIELYESNMIPFASSTESVVDALLSWGYTLHKVVNRNGATAPYEYDLEDNLYNFVFLSTD
ncbi:FkbM family methyltransferase [Planktotalea arctica]|uniref:FkbM family methyltransferase n=1 Tax=Planktotalea arctica TaxID=1481893 RepID=UPI00321C03B0